MASPHVPLESSKQLFSQIEALQAEYKQVCQSNREATARVGQERSAIGSIREACDAHRLQMRDLIRRRVDAEIRLFELTIQVESGNKLSDTIQPRSAADLASGVEQMYAKLRDCASKLKNAYTLLEAQTDTFCDTSTVHAAVESERQSQLDLLNRWQNDVISLQKEHDAAKHKLDALLQTVDSKAFMTSVLDEELSALKSEDQAIAENLPETISIQDADARKLQTSIAVATREQETLRLQLGTLRDRADFATKTKARAGTTRKTSYQGRKRKNYGDSGNKKHMCRHCKRYFSKKQGLATHLRWCKLKAKDDKLQRGVRGLEYEASVHQNTPSTAKRSKYFEAMQVKSGPKRPSVSESVKSIALKLDSFEAKFEAKE